MVVYRRGALALALVLLAPANAAAAVPPNRLHAEYFARVADISSPAVLLVDVTAFEVRANGSAAPRPEWDERVRQNVVAALEAALRARGMAVSRIAPELADGAAFKDVTALYRHVMNASRQAYETFPGGRDRFDYTLGDLGDLLAPSGADALLLVHAAAGAAALYAYSESGDADGFVSSGVILASLVDRRGSVLCLAWAMSRDADLREPDGAARAVAKLLEGIPGALR